MTGISLRDFHTTALQSGGGTVRLAKGTDDELVNKGTFGNKVASFFQNASRAIGLLRTDDRQMRQMEALQRFKEVLHNTYDVPGDTSIADNVLAAVGLDEPDAKLTGRVILAAINAAKAEVAQRRAGNLQEMSNLMPPEPGHDASAGFKLLAESLNPPLDPTTLTDEQRQDYAERLRTAVSYHGLNGAKALSSQEIQGVAREALKQVVKLGQMNGLEAAAQARTAYATALKSILTTLATGGDATKLTADLMRALDRYDQLVMAEQVSNDAGQDVLLDLSRQGLQQAIRELGAENPGLLRKAQANAMSDDSSLRALYAAAGQRTDPGRGQTVGRFMSLMMETVGELARPLSAFTGTRAEDRGRLMDDTSVPRRALDRANAALDQAFSRLPALSGPVLTGLHERYQGKDEETGLPNWHSPAILMEVEEALHGMMETHDMSLEQGVADFRQALAADQTLPPPLKDKLTAALDGIVEEQRLQEALKDKPAFQGIAAQDLARLFSVGGERAGGQEITKWDLEHNGQGSLAGMCRGLRMMLTSDQPLSVDLLAAVHTEGTRDTFRNDVLQQTYKTSDNPIMEATLRDMDAVYLDEARIVQGFRNGSVEFPLHIATELSDAGREALDQLAKEGDEGQRWVAKFEPSLTDKNFMKVSVADKSSEQIRARVDEILARFDQEMQAANGDDEKRLAIAGAVQDLYRSHIFQDGNTRTLVFTLMNRMLVDAGMDPAILSEPKRVAGYSRAEFAAEIAAGQQAFQALRH